jgi:uncharacterized protein YndB with AHSA1/START domain/DNA-binding transcriptional ArsR family regulator
VGEATEMDPVFRALADRTRRRLLDRLREQDGQTLRELCEHLDMARQSATQHVDVLVAAHLVTVVRRGRERLHFLNPVPIQEIERRWISVFDRPRLAALSAIKDQAEEYAMTDPPVPDYVYVTYIRARPEQVWRALTDADLTARYWGHANVSDWQPGSTWEHRRVDGSGAVDVVGKVLESEPPTRLVITFEDSPDEAREPSVVTFLVEPHEEIVRLTVTHEKLPNAAMLGGISAGWPAVLANLKSLLETGEVLPQSPWDMAPAHT